MKVSLIIPTYNKLPRLKLTVASIMGQKCPFEDFEVIFANDGSTDGTEEFLRNSTFPFNYRCIHSENKGRAGARNIAIESAENEILIFSDDDCILHPMFITEHLKEQREALKIVHGRIHNLSYLKFFEDPTNGTFYPDCDTGRPSEFLVKMCISEKDILQNFEVRIGSCTKVTPFERVTEILLTQHNSTADWVSFNGGNTGVPKQWIEEAGGFDENFGTTWGCEDLEMGYRLYGMNKKFTYSPCAANYHISHYRKKLKGDHRSTLSYFYEKYKDEKILQLQDFVDEKIDLDKFVHGLL